MVCTSVDDFWCCLSCDGIVEAVLNHLVKLASGWRVAVVVVRTFRIDVGYLLPDTAFTGSDTPNPFQQLPKVILSKYSFPLFQPFVIQNESLAYILVQYLCSPNAELCGTG